MPRDNFSAKTIFALAAGANFTCVKPGCNQRTHYFDRTSDRWTRNGIAAHDTAAAAGGPRFDETLTPEQRRAYENGAWLCPTHAGLADKTPWDYPPGTLARWQADAEGHSRSLVHDSGPASRATPREAAQGIACFLSRTGKVQFNGYELPHKTVAEIYSLRRDAGDLGPANQLSAQLPELVHIQRELLDDLNHLAREVTTGARWVLVDDVYQLAPPLLSADGRANESSRAQVMELWRRVQEATRRLREFMQYGAR